MNLMQGFNQAIKYIEDNLDGEIDYEKAAQKSGYSVYYFQRIFSCISGISLAEYIRRRKMTLAAMELQNSRIRIIDLAVKYGYDSADSFARAFQTLHGVTPSAARHEGVQLKSFPPMSFHIAINGEKEVNYRIEIRSEMRVVGLVKHFQAPENSEKDVPAFWNQVFENGMYVKLLALSTGDPLGVHGFIHVINDKAVDYMIASVSDMAVPDGMEECIIPASTWAIFETVGPVASAMEELWNYIYQEWLPSSNYTHANTMEIECFRYQGYRQADNFKFEVWIPV